MAKEIVSKKGEVALRSEMDKLDAERSRVKSQLDRERLLSVTNDVIETITSPEFIDRMRKAREMADEEDGMAEVSKLLSLDGLRKAGASIPEDFRLTSRVFEDKKLGLRYEVRPGRADISDIGMLSWGACGGAGGLTFCGCGGFST